MDAPPVQYVMTSDGYRIAYAVAGEGPTLIRMPGLWNHFSLQWSSSVYQVHYESLASRYRLVLYDGRGQGLSSRGLKASLRLSDYQHDLDALVGRVAADRFILLGFEALGTVAIEYAVRHPERTAALVLWNFLDSTSADYSASLQSLAENSWDFFIQTIAQIRFPGSESAMTSSLLRDSMTRDDLLAHVRVLRSSSSLPLLSEVKVPTLVLATRAQNPARVEGARQVASQIPGAKLVLLDTNETNQQPTPGIPSIAIPALESFVEPLVAQERGTQEPAGRSTTALSIREMEVLRLVAAGKSNAQIADELVISQNTVIRHVSNIFAKTGVANRAEAASYAHRNGIV
jgi:DNA-binding CsgD family transcriptional regulator/pimeloyl-ACP methyl ester carboxylesterase